ncbi:unnamed protein product [Pylaiella littoralis]
MVAESQRAWATLWVLNTSSQVGIGPAHRHLRLSVLRVGENVNSTSYLGKNARRKTDPKSSRSPVNAVRESKVSTCMRFCCEQENLTVRVDGCDHAEDMKRVRLQKKMGLTG